MTERLVLVTRCDLSPGYQSVQPAHALAEFMVTFPIVARRWHKNHKNLIVLAAPNELALVNLFKKVEEAGLKCVLFREPDIANEVTVIAIEPNDLTYRMTSSLPLALKNYAEVDRVPRDKVSEG